MMIQQFTSVPICKRQFRRIFLSTFLLFLASPAALGQESIADLIIRVKPSVVKIIVYDMQGKQTVSGSGFFISKTKVMTNKHVVAGAHSVGIKMSDGSLVYAHNIQNVPDIDIAILDFKPNGKFIKPLPIAAISPREGDKIIVIGSPLGLEGSVSDGIVSAIRKISIGNYLQITAPISPGSSGSPVVDISGHVVGIATLNIEGGQSLNFAIPAQQVASFWVNQVSSDSPVVNDPLKQESPKRSEMDLTGNWVSLMETNRYQIIDDGQKLSIVVFWKGYARSENHIDVKWIGNVIIGQYISSYDPFYFIIKVIDSERISLWRVWSLKPTDSDEKILQRLTKQTQKKPDEILKRIH